MHGAVSPCLAPRRLSDYEAKLLLPVLVEKCGHNQVRLGASVSRCLPRSLLPPLFDGGRAGPLGSPHPH
jgi:hypothetical protein